MGRRGELCGVRASQTRIPPKRKRCLSPLCPRPVPAFPVSSSHSVCLVPGACDPPRNAQRRTPHPQIIGNQRSTRGGGTCHLGPAPPGGPGRLRGVKPAPAAERGWGSGRDPEFSAGPAGPSMRCVLQPRFYGCWWAAPPGSGLFQHRSALPARPSINTSRPPPGQAGLPRPGPSPAGAGGLLYLLRAGALPPVASPRHSVTVSGLRPWRPRGPWPLKARRALLTAKARGPASGGQGNQPAFLAIPYCTRLPVSECVNENKMIYDLRAEQVAQREEPGRSSLFWSRVPHRELRKRDSRHLRRPGRPPGVTRGRGRGGRPGGCAPQAALLRLGLLTWTAALALPPPPPPSTDCSREPERRGDPGGAPGWRWPGPWGRLALPPPCGLIRNVSVWSASSTP